MIEYVLADAGRRYQEGQEALARRDAEGVLGAYHGALESLLRWNLVRDGADHTVAFDPEAVTWDDLLVYLDVRGVPPEQIEVLTEMHGIHAAILNKQSAIIRPRQAVAFARITDHLFSRFWPDTGATPPMPPEVEPIQAAEPTVDTMVPPVAEPVQPEQPQEVHSSVDPTLQMPVSPPPPPADETAVREAFGAQAEFDVAVDEAQREKVIAAGARLREMQALGYEFCPKCLMQVPGTSEGCPYCGFDMITYRQALKAPHQRRGANLFSRLLGRT